MVIKTIRADINDFFKVEKTKLHQFKILRFFDGNKFHIHIPPSSPQEAKIVNSQHEPCNKADPEFNMESGCRLVTE